MTDGVDGLLIPIKDEEALVAGINRLIEEPELAQRLGMEARKIADRANAETIFAQWRDYMEELCGQGQSKLTGGK